MHFFPWEKRFGFYHRIIAEDKLWGFIEDDYYHYLNAAGYSKTAFADLPEYHQNHMACISPLPWEYTCDHFVGRESARWIEECEGEAPFAMMVGFPGPHSPYDLAPEYAQFNMQDLPEPIGADPDDTKLRRTPGRTWSLKDNNRFFTRKSNLKNWVKNEIVALISVAICDHSLSLPYMTPRIMRPFSRTKPHSICTASQSTSTLSQIPPTR